LRLPGDKGALGGWVICEKPRCRFEFARGQNFRDRIAASGQIERWRRNVRDGVNCEALVQAIKFNFEMPCLSLQRICSGYRGPDGSKLGNAKRTREPT